LLIPFYAYLSLSVVPIRIVDSKSTSFIEINIESCSGTTIKWLFYRFTRNPTAITNDDIDEFVSRYSAPGAMRAGFVYYGALLEDIIQSEEYSKVKLPMPVLALRGECSNGTAAIHSIHMVVTNVSNVSGRIVPDTGHCIPEEQPDFLLNQLIKFFANK
jgi:pimeloyl-ACP methyl ester carboxylesterase